MAHKTRPQPPAGSRVAPNMGANAGRPAKEPLVVLLHRDFSQLNLIGESMGGWHEHFARAAVEAGASVVELYLAGAPIAQAVVYSLDLGPYVLGVVYYVAVKRELRGRGYGWLLVGACERVLEAQGARLFAATIEAENQASIALFRSRDYTIYSWSEVSAACGRRAAEAIRMATCGYEHWFALKGGALAELCGLDRKKARKWWGEACLKPWLKLVGRGRS